MSNLIVRVTTVAGGFTAVAQQGPREQNSASSCPEMAARIAAASLLGLFLADVTAEQKAPGIWRCVPRHGALLQEAAP